MHTHFNNYTVEQFLDDPIFIRWVKFCSTEDEAFWRGWVASNPANLEAFNSAKLRLSAILSANTLPDDQDIKETIWNSIHTSINTKNNIVRPLFTRWLAAASVILVLITSIWFWSNNGKEKSLIATNVNKKISNDIAPGGNKAVLTLANGSTIILDSAQNGTLSQQGNSKVIKLADGKLAYQKENSEETKIQNNTITTPRGGQYQLTLSDGSRVWLNAASSLRFPVTFSGEERRVELTGEGYFEVAHNKEKPFIVLINKSEIEVLGTHFNINGYTDENNLKTTLLEGSVKVSKGAESVLIKPGQQAVVNNSSEAIVINQQVNLEEIMAWKNGLFNFNEADIRTVMNQLSRWYDVNIIYVGTIPKREFGGEMQRDLKLSQVLGLLEKNKVHFKIEGKNLVVMP